MISNCGKDEYSGACGGCAGDQTGGEWWLIPWYKGGWQCVLRHPSSDVGIMIAELAAEAAENDRIGYDQSERMTFWTQLQASGFSPKRITVPCEADCSSGVAAIVKAAGHLLGNDRLKAVSPDLNTFRMRQALSSAGFRVLTDPMYLRSDAQLIPGDILLNDDSHVAINVSRGSMPAPECPSDPDPVPEEPLDAEWEPEQGFFADLDADGEYGPLTEEAVREFQRQFGLTPDGICGPKTADKIFEQLEGLILRSGDTGWAVTALQAILNYISEEV